MRKKSDKKRKHTSYNPNKSIKNKEKYYDYQKILDNPPKEKHEWTGNKFYAKTVFYGFYKNLSQKANFKYNSEEWNNYLYRQNHLNECREEITKISEYLLDIKYEDAFYSGKTITCEEFWKLEKNLYQEEIIVPPQELINKILDAEKQYMTYKNFANNSLENKIIGTQYLYECEVDGIKHSIILEIANKKRLSNGFKHYTIKGFWLINGTIQFEIFRYDNKKAFHGNRFLNGKICRGKEVNTRNLNNQSAHLHIYNEIFTLVFPCSYCHYDIEILPFNSKNPEEQCKYLQQRFNFDGEITKSYTTKNYKKSCNSRKKQRIENINKQQSEIIDDFFISDSSIKE